MRNCHGRVTYRAPHGEIGRETFSINRIGQQTLIRAYCEMDEKALVRDTAWTLDHDHAPIEGYVRIALGDRLMGSSWYRFSADGVDCETCTSEHGRVSQHLPGDWAYLGLHPLVGDGMIAAVRGIDAPGVERWIESVTCSYSPDGETGLMALPISIGVTYVGAEPIGVAAGTFDALRYRIRWQADWPSADLWVMREEFVILKLLWPAVDVVHELDRFDWTSGAEARS